MKIDYERLQQSVEAGTLRIELEQELETGFREMAARGERIPPASYIATKIAEIVDQGTDEGLGKDLAFSIYQEISSACENARERVVEDEPKPS
ncbi:MAG: hypothetical protein KY432_00975 [Acidobacteria bacterium]|nr:hypothetical protein [Acidobacteriota bacterium]